MQQNKEHRRKPSAYYEGTYYKEIPNVYIPETLLQQSTTENRGKTIVKNRRMSTTMAYTTSGHKEEASTAKQKSYSGVSNLVCQFLTSSVCTSHIKLLFIPY